MTGLYPYYCEAYSTEAIDYPGNAEKSIEIVNKVISFIGTKSTWAIDRQGDDIDPIRCFTEKSLQFVTQLKMYRYLHFGNNSIRNKTVLVHAIAYFTSIYPGISMKFKIMVQKIFFLTKRFFSVSSFLNYAMTDGIFELLKYSKQGVIEFRSRIGLHHYAFQLSLFPD